MSALTAPQVADVVDHLYATHEQLHAVDESAAFDFCITTGLYDHAQGDDSDEQLVAKFAASLGLPHPAVRSWGIDVFALRPGDILTDEHGNDYEVNPGFKEDQSSCWRSSRFVSVTLIDPARYYPHTYVDPGKCTVRAAQ